MTPWKPYKVMKPFDPACQPCDDFKILLVVTYAEDGINMNREVFRPNVDILAEVPLCCGMEEAPL